MENGNQAKKSKRFSIGPIEPVLLSLIVKRWKEEVRKVHSWEDALSAIDSTGFMGHGNFQIYHYDKEGDLLKVSIGPFEVRTPSGFNDVKKQYFEISPDIFYERYKDYLEPLD